MTNAIPRSLEEAVANKTVNAYMLSLLLSPHLLSGDAVVVPPDKLRNYIRKAREQLRNRKGVVQYHVKDNQYLVAFQDDDGQPAFEKVIPFINLKKI